MNAIGQLRFTVPRVATGRYVFALLCDTCVPGPKGSLIVEARRVLRVHS